MHFMRRVSGSASVAVLVDGTGCEVLKSVVDFLVINLPFETFSVGGVSRVKTGRRVQPSFVRQRTSSSCAGRCGRLGVDGSGLGVLGVAGRVSFDGTCSSSEVGNGGNGVTGGVRILVRIAPVRAMRSSRAHSAQSLAVIFPMVTACGPGGLRNVSSTNTRSFALIRPPCVGVQLACTISGVSDVRLRLASRSRNRFSNSRAS